MVKRDYAFDGVLLVALPVGHPKARYSARHSNFWDGHLVQP